MRVQHMQGQFGAGRSHHYLLHGSFTLTTTLARTNSRTGERTYP
jgi:hypothetical protein